MQKLAKGYILPSAAFSINRGKIKYYSTGEKKPEAGDLVYGVVRRIGQHSSLENKSGRIHMAHNGTKAIFVFGNRYAPDYYEGFVPDSFSRRCDLLSRSGLIGIVRTKNALIKDPTQIEVLGYVMNEKGSILNTRSHPLIIPKTTVKRYPRSRMILVCGTAMNSGKSAAAAACCWVLSTLGHRVRGSKITGTASLKDILHMNDAGASSYSDFTCLGYPSTYLLSTDELNNIFNVLDLKYANNPKNYWVVELADGINQRETSLLLRSRDLRERIHRLIFCANDAFGAIGGLEVLKERFNLSPDALSGICASSPLYIRELAEFTDLPVFNSAAVDSKKLSKILMPD